MPDVKSFVRNNNAATIICPTCHKAKHINAEPYRYKKHAIKVRCSSGEQFTLCLDFRRHYRKLINLPGTYTITTPGKIGSGAIQIRNISRGGIGFTVTNPRDMNKDLDLILEFHLNDKNADTLPQTDNYRALTPATFHTKNHE